MATGADIISTTLPTVIGMGVVSKSTDTLFSKGGRRRARKVKLPARPRIHTGKRGGKYIVKKGRRIYI